MEFTRRFISLPCYQLCRLTLLYTQNISGPILLLTKYRLVNLDLSGLKFRGESNRVVSFLIFFIEHLAIIASQIRNLKAISYTHKLNILQYNSFISTGSRKVSRSSSLENSSLFSRNATVVVCSARRKIKIAQIIDQENYDRRRFRRVQDVNVAPVFEMTNGAVNFGLVPFEPGRNPSRETAGSFQIDGRFVNV